MKILYLSDLHRSPTCKYEDKFWRNIFDEEDPDIVCITGDVHEYNTPVNPFEDLGHLFPGVPVVFTLGNHEFFFSSVEDTLKRYSEYPNDYDVHCLDLDDYYIKNGIAFVGNVLWYDGSMSTQPTQNLHDWQGWMDSSIDNGVFDYAKASKACQRRIEKAVEKVSSKADTVVLMTHCVPHRRLNGHINNRDSPYNAYSGLDNYLRVLREKGLHVDISLSGHTHWRVSEIQLEFVCCYNVGNDYVRGDHRYKCIDI